MNSGETYKIAAEEHVVVASELFVSGRYVLAHYVSGLAVECMFRAYKARKSDEFDERHDLRELAKSSRFFDSVTDDDEQSKSLWLALSVCVEQWRNNHRYRSGAGLRKFLRDERLDRGIKGDFVKELSRRIVGAAHELVGAGARQWES